MADYNAGTIEAVVDANTRPYTAAMMRAAATTRTATAAMSRNMDSASRSTERLSGNMAELSKQAFNLSAVTSQLAIGGIASLVRPAAAAIDALTGGVVILTKSITDLSGVVVGLPIGLSAAVEGFGAVKFATMGLADVVKAYASGDSEKIREALKATSAEAGAFAKELHALTPAMREIRDTAAQGLFPGLTEGLKEATRNLPVLKAAMGSTASTLGDLARQAGVLLGSDLFGTRFTTITARNNALLAAAGGSAIKFADALTLLMVKAKPVSDYMTRMAAGLGLWAQGTVYAGAQTGSLTSYFQTAVDAFKDWWAVLTNTGNLLKGLFAGAAPYAEEFRNWLVTTTGLWKQWAQSAAGTKAIEEFFARIQGPLKATAALFHDLGKAIWDLGNTDEAMRGFTTFAETLRTKLLPALQAMASQVGPEMANSLALLATAIAKLLNVGSFNPFLTLVKWVSNAVIALTDLIGKIPGMNEFVGVLTSIYMTTRLFNATKFLAFLSGATKLFAGNAVAARLFGAANVEVAASAAAATGAIGAETAAMGQMTIAGRAYATTATGLVVPANAAITASSTAAAGASTRLGTAIGGTALGKWIGNLSLLGKGGLIVGVAYGVTKLGGALTNYNRYARDAVDATDAVNTKLHLWTQRGEGATAAAIDLEHALGNVLRIFDSDWDDSWRASSRWFEEWDANIASGITRGGDSMRSALAQYRQMRDLIASQLVGTQMPGGIQKLPGVYTNDISKNITQIQAEKMALEKLREEAPKAAAAIQKYKDTHYGMSLTLMNATDKAQALYVAVKTLGDAEASAGAKTTAFAAAIDILAGAEQSYLATTISLYQAEKAHDAAIRDQIKSKQMQGLAFVKGTNHLKVETDAQLRAAQAAQQNSKYVLDVTKATYAQTHSVQASLAVYNQERAAFIENARAMGLKESAARRLANSLLGIPTKVQTIITVPGAMEVLNRTGSIKATWQWLLAHPKLYLSATANLSITRTINEVLNQIPGGMFGGGKGGKHRARGGLVTGPGTSLSDSIPAWLSTGEFVVNAAATRKHKGLLRAVNAGRFAKGGNVGPTTVWTAPQTFNDKHTREALEQTHTALRDLTRTLRDNLAQAKQAMRERVQGIRGQVMGFGAITNTGGTEYLSGQGLLEEMQARAKMSRRFLRQTRTLDRMGLNKQSMKEIVDAGPQAGSQIAAALLEGSRKAVKERLAEVNRLEHQIQRTGRRLGVQEATREGYADKIRRAREGLGAGQGGQVNVHDGAVRVQMDFTGVDPKDSDKIKRAVEKAMDQAIRGLTRQLRAHG